MLDINGRRLVVHRQPADGIYASIRSYSESVTVCLEGRSECVAVADVLPPVPTAP